MSVQGNGEPGALSLVQGGAVSTMCSESACLREVQCGQMRQKQERYKCNSLKKIAVIRVFFSLKTSRVLLEIDKKLLYFK